jgi:putative ABC transport system permease protein
VVAQVDKQQAVYDIMTMEQRLSQELSFYRIHVQLFGIFSGMAVFMAVLGIYGVMSYSAKRRTHEIGVRMTLGATTGTILKLVVGTGLKLTLIGIALGVAAALLLTRLMAHLLFEVKPFDAATFTIISVALIGVGLMASYLPARRATKVDPMLALRYE